MFLQKLSSKFDSQLHRACITISLDYHSTELIWSLERYILLTIKSIETKQKNIICVCVALIYQFIYNKINTGKTFFTHGFVKVV